MIDISHVKYHEERDMGERGREREHREKGQLQQGMSRSPTHIYLSKKKKREIKKKETEQIK